MSDRVTVEVRSAIMRSVRSSGNRSTEARFRAGLVRAGVRGWVVLPSGVPGRPDIAFPEARLAVFVDGCFWHGCPVCQKTPGTNVEYWSRKLERNHARDLSVERQLASSGWRVLRIWEHELKDLNGVVQKVSMALGRVRS